MKITTLTEQQVLAQGLTIENNMLESIDVALIAHFNNTTTLDMRFKNCCLFSSVCMGSILSEVLKIVVEFLGISEEDGLQLSSIKNIPVRIVVNQSNSVVGFGDFMQNRFVLASNILDVAKANVRNEYGAK